MDSFSQQPSQKSYEQYIRAGVPSKREIDVFLNELSWAKFDAEVGYKLGNYIPRDGIEKSSTISTVQESRARRSFMYVDEPCRINTYGNSFTQCHQVSDGETWQEYLAAHLGEPVRNFGMGGYGAYQSYRRMLQEEKTKYAAKYIIYYIWGDDHIRSLLRCRYMLTQTWMREQYAKEGIGKMFHGNFWPNIEMDLEKGVLVEKNSLVSTSEELYYMTNPDWMYANLKDDLALQMALYKKGLTTDVDIEKLKLLAKALKYSVDLDNKVTIQKSVNSLLNKYAFAATKYILAKVQDYATVSNKKLMVVIFDPYDVTKSLLTNEARYDQEVIDYLRDNHFSYFDMNLVHTKDYQNYKLSIDDYYKRYFIGHYNPAGNHFFAYSIKSQIVEWLSPKPITYSDSSKQLTDFKGYLEGLDH